MKAQLYLYLAWTLASLLTLGSFYMNFIEHKEPCTLCWYERLCLFPLTIILGVALYQRFLGIFSYAIAFPIFGAAISGFHIALQEIPSFHPFKVCSSAVSCALKESIGLGWVSPPMLACAGSIAIALLLCLSRSSHRIHS